MTWLTPSRYPVLALVLSASLLAGAWIFQYGFGYAPCQMCYWQRHAHKGVIAVAILAIIAAKLGLKYPRILCVLIIAALLVSAGMGGWHMGVEYGWWDGPQGCMAGDFKVGAFNPDALLEALDQKIKPPSCGEVVWSFLGLSMAGWNMILSLGGAVFGLVAMGRKRSV